MISMKRSRLPEDLRAFLCTSDGLSLSWTVKLHGKGGEGGGPGGSSDREVVAGRIYVGGVSAITRIPLDADDLRSIKLSSRCVADAIAADAPAPAPGALDLDRDDTTGNRDAYDLAAFSIDSACEVGRVALVYGVPRRSPPPRRRGSRSCSGENSRVTSRSAVEAWLVNPEVWIQDLSCR